MHVLTAQALNDSMREFLQNMRSTHTKPRILKKNWRLNQEKVFKQFLIPVTWDNLNNLEY